MCSESNVKIDFMKCLINTYMEAPSFEAIKSSYKNFKDLLGLMNRVDFLITELSAQNENQLVDVPEAMKKLMLPELKKGYHIIDEYIRVFITKLPKHEKQRLIFKIDTVANKLKLLQTMSDKSNMDLETKLLMNEYELFLEYITHSI